MNHGQGAGIETGDVYRIGFIIEQALGHVTHGRNLEAAVRQDPSVDAQWGFPAQATAGIGARLPFFRSNWTLQAGWRTRRLLAAMDRLGRLDALFFHTQVPAVLSPDWLKRIPSILSLDATPRQYDAMGRQYGHAVAAEWLETWKWRLNRHCYRAARRLVTWSEWARRGLIEGYGVPAEKVTVIPPGVDTRAWAAPAPRRRPSAAPVRILFVGGDYARKGGPLLLEAFRALRRQWPRIELHVVTPQRIAREPGVCSYHDLPPNHPKLKALYFESHIFCLPSLADCLALAVLEAGAAGLPAVATRVGALGEAVLDGETGFLVPPRDVRVLVEALSRLVEDPDLRLRQGARAVAHVRLNFDSRRNTRRLLDLLKRTADENRAAGWPAP